jgi:hypothetical protein
MEVRDYQKRRSTTLVTLGFAVWTPDTSGKSPDTPEIPESPGFSTPEFPGFAAETLNHNAARFIHPN